MAVLRLDRFTTGAAGTGEMPARHAALAAVVKDAYPGLIDTQLAASDQTWTGVRRWDSLASAQAAVAGAPAIPGRGRSRSPKPSPRNTPWSSMQDRTRPVHGEQAAGLCGRRDPRRWAWHASPPPRLRHRPDRPLAAGRGGERP